MNTGNKIDDLFRESLDGYRIEPSISLWKRIERRFFPPSRFSPSGLITSGILIFIAGLMPWVLIPATGGEPKQSVPQPEGTVRGYILNPTDHNPKYKASEEHTYTVQTTYIKEEKVDESNAEQTMANNDNQALMDEPSVFLIANASPKSIYPAPVPEEEVEPEYRDPYWYLRMHSHPAGLMDASFIATLQNDVIQPTYESAFTDNYENDYFKKTEFSLGASFDPYVVFYDPNPTNKMLGGELNARYQVSNWYFQGGIGYSNMEDIGSYKINYKSNDSVGYFINVIGFVPDPRNPGTIEYTTREETIYDTVDHIEITDRTNHYSYLDFPVSLGYTFFQRGRVTFGINTGVKFSVLIGKDEPTVDFNIPNGELIDIERQVPSRASTTWRFTAGLDFGYLLSDKISLHLEPVYEQYISPLYSTQPGLKPKKPAVTGLKAGFRYTF